MKKVFTLSIFLMISANLFATCKITFKGKYVTKVVQSTQLADIIVDFGQSQLAVKGERWSYINRLGCQQDEAVLKYLFLEDDEFTNVCVVRGECREKRTYRIEVRGSVSDFAYWVHYPFRTTSTYYLYTRERVIDLGDLGEVFN